MSQTTRRSLLKGVLVAAAAGATGTVLTSSTAQAVTAYGPRSISHVGDYGAPPGHLNYRMWNFASGTTLSAALARMAPNDCLVLPERSTPYLIDTSHGFYYPGTYRAMARATGGIHGMGPGAVIEYGPSAFSQGRASGTSGNLNRVIESSTAGAYFGNFTMKGRSLGGCGFDGIKATGNYALFENLRLLGANHGWINNPPGETGGIVGFQGSGQTVRNCEIDSRDSTGRRVGTSPLMFNQQSNVTVQDVWAHHALAGAITCWRVNNATMRRTRSEYNGSGSGWINGHAFNIEQSTGTVLLDNCTFICNYGANTGVHLSVGSYYSNPAKVRVVSPVHDVGPYRGVFAVNISPTYGGRTQTVTPSSISVVNSTGGAVAWRH